MRSDQTVALVSFYPAKAYPERLRRITYVDPESSERFVFLTNQFALPAITITQLQHLRWQIELFSKWIKQHLRIKSFFGTSENAVKTQIWITITVFEKSPMNELLTGTDYIFNEHHSPNQLELFDL